MGTSRKLTKSEEILNYTSRCRRAVFGTQETATPDASRWSPLGQEPRVARRQHNLSLTPGAWGRLFQHGNTLSVRNRSAVVARHLTWFGTFWVNGEFWAEDIRSFQLRMESTFDSGERD